MKIRDSEKLSSLRKSYEPKILGIRLYQSDKKEFRVDDFIELSVLENFIDELFTCESDITLTGKDFLKEYYGFDQLAILLNSRKNLKEEIGSYSVKKLTTWLKTVEPMFTLNFIETVRENSKDTKD